MKAEIKTALIFFVIGLIIIFAVNLVVSNISSVPEPVSGLNEYNLASSFVPLSGSDTPFPSDTERVDESFPVLINDLFTWGVAIAIVLAVLFVVFGAIQYMTTDAVFQKTEGRQKIMSAVIGLILALVSWLILNTINSTIVQEPFKFLQSINETGE